MHHSNILHNTRFLSTATIERQEYLSTPSLGTAVILAAKTITIHPDDHF